MNLLSIYGAVAELCDELTKDLSVTEKPAANENLESMVVQTEFPNADSHTNVELQGNLLQKYEHKFAQLPEDQKMFKLCFNAGLSKIVGKGQFFITLSEEEGLDEMKNSCREYTFPRSEETSRVVVWILKIRRSARSWM